MKTLSIDPATADLHAMVERGTLLHGHLGPFLVAGIRMGLLALSLLGSHGYFGLHAESEAGTKTPLSCLNDGIQIGSGCTAGKGNLRIVGDGTPRVRFATEDGRTVIIEVRRDVIDSFRDSDLMAKSRELEMLPLGALFEWTEPSSS